MRGRRPKPTTLKVITGNPGKRPLPASEPKPPPALKLPEPPLDLGDDALAEWKRVTPRLLELGLVTEVDLAPLAAYCQAYGRWVDAEAQLENEGLTLTTSKGNVIQNPLLGIANKARNDMVRFAAEFGMTPSARTRVKAEAAEPNNEPARKYF